MPNPPSSPHLVHAYSLSESGYDPQRVAALARAHGFTDAQIEAGAASDFKGVGTLDSNVVIRLIPVEDAQKLLPEGLELAPQPIAPPGSHPVFLLFSTDHFDAWFGSMDYQELMVGIPYVQLRDSHAVARGPYIYMPRLYLNDEAPLFLGNHIYGYEKLWGDIETTRTSYEVFEKDTRDAIVRARFVPQGQQGAPESFENFDLVRKLFEMPTVSQALRIADANAFEFRAFATPFICSTITYDFASPKACVQSIRADVDVSDRLTPRGFPPGSFAMDGLSHHRLGAFRIKVPQTVSAPGSCPGTRFDRPAPKKRERVVVLGSGPSACAAAYYLAKQTERYEVSMYTLGWRMGGKCAAGRNPDAAYRIEEHGLHAFLGFYRNALRTVRELYNQIGIDPAVGEPPYDYENGEGPIANAFVGQNNIGVLDQWNGQWSFFSTDLGRNNKIPGEVPEGGDDVPQGLGHIMVHGLRRVSANLGEMAAIARSESEQLHGLFEGKKKGESLWHKLVAEVEHVVSIGEHALNDAVHTLSGYIEGLVVDEMIKKLEQGSALFVGISWLLKFIRTGLRVYYKEKIETSKEAWFKWSGLDLALTALIGIIDSKTVHFDSLDDHDFRTWLLDHGLDPRNKDITALTEVYMTMFANGSKTPEPDNMAAGVALRWFLLTALGYDGYPTYEFKYSCPQTLLTPYYLALKQLGVKIHFFHKVEELIVDGQGEGRTLKGIRFQRQATVIDGGDKYDPFLRKTLSNNPSELPPWPIEPDYAQLVEGAQLKQGGVNLEDAWTTWCGAGERTLEHGKDFDICVCGLSFGALPAVASGLTDPEQPSSNPAWASAIEGIKLTQTISMQLWMDVPWTSLYSGLMRGLSTGYRAPEPSFGDFTHVVQWEAWPKEHTPKFLAYHTGALVSGDPLAGHPPTEHDYPAKMSAKWRADAKAWLAESYQGMYDKMGSFDEFLSHLVDPNDPKSEGESRLDAQYFNIGVQPWDLYVLSQAGATGLRLKQGESGYQNLFLCGDWTRTDLNCGCVEASTQSGMLCARVISNEPRYVWRVGF